MEEEEENDSSQHGGGPLGFGTDGVCDRLGSTVKILDEQCCVWLVHARNAGGADCQACHRCSPTAHVRNRHGNIQTELTPMAKSVDRADNRSSPTGNREE